MKSLAFLLSFLVITNVYADDHMSITIQQAKEKHQERLMALPGVVSIGIGLSGEEKVIIIGLDGKKSDTEETLPKQLEGFKVIYQVTGSIKAQ